MNYYPKMTEQNAAEQQPTQTMYPKMEAERQTQPNESGSVGNDDQSKGDADGPSDDKNPQAEAVLPSDQWQDELSKGNYDGVGAAVLSELSSMGASEAELASARSLCCLASEKRDNPEWREWSLQMLDWVRGLRG